MKIIDGNRYIPTKSNPYGKIIRNPILGVSATPERITSSEMSALLGIRASKLLADVNQVSARIESIRIWCLLNFETMTEYNGFLVEV